MNNLGKELTEFLKSEGIKLVDGSSNAVDMAETMEAFANTPRQLIKNFQVGDIVECFKEDPMDAHVGIAVENRWMPGDQMVVEDISIAPWGCFLCEGDKNLNVQRARLVRRGNNTYFGIFVIYNGCEVALRVHNRQSLGSAVHEAVVRTGNGSAFDFDGNVCKDHSSDKVREGFKMYWNGSLESQGVKAGTLLMVGPKIWFNE